MRLEAHIDQEDEIIHQLTVIVRRMEEALLKLRSDHPLEGLKLTDDELIGVMLLEWDVEENELVPRGMEELVQEVVLLCVAP